MRFEHTPAMMAAPIPKESGDITTAPIKRNNNKFYGNRLLKKCCFFFFLNDPSDSVYSGALAHLLYMRNSLHPQDTHWCSVVMSPDWSASAAVVVRTSLSPEVFRTSSYTLFSEVLVWLMILGRILCWSLSKSKTVIRFTSFSILLTLRVPCI